jgi:DNA-binding NarL/FixJ family response regulator
MAIRLVLADDHPIVLQGLKQLFEQHSGFEVAAACASGEEAIRAVTAHEPDVAVLDLRMGSASGLDVVRALTSAKTRCRFVILTAVMRDEDVAEAVQLGVAGLVLKESSPDSLVDCVRAVAAGERWIRHESFVNALAGAVRAQAAPTPQSTLTPRELEIVRLVAQGLRNKEIAERLSITEGTVKVHLHKAYDKLGVDSRIELVLAAQFKRLL